MAEVNIPIDIPFSDLPSNSDKSKVEKTDKKVEKPEKRIKKVVSNEVTVKKKGFLSNFKKSMVSEDASSVGEYVIKDIVLPTVKDLIFEAVRGSLEMILWGSTSGRRNGRKNIPYNSLNSGTAYYYGGVNNTHANDIPKHKSIDYFDVNNFMFKSRRDAEEVLSTLQLALEEYPSVSIADFYDALGMSAPHTAYNYGWTNLSGVDIRSYRGEYYIEFPQYKQIK